MGGTRWEGVVVVAARGREGREEGVGEAMDDGELRRRKVAAAIWKGGGGGCDLEGTSADPTAGVGEKGRGGESPRRFPPTRLREGSVELAGRKGTGSRGARVCAGEEGDGIERSEGKKGGGGGGWMEIDPEDIARVSGLVWMGRGQPLDPRASDGVGCTIRVICPRTNQNAVDFMTI